MSPFNDLHNFSADLAENFENETAVVDLIDHPPDSIGFIVMEEWSSQLITDGGPSCLTLFFAAVRQCIEVNYIFQQNYISRLDQG